MSTTPTTTGARARSAALRSASKAKRAVHRAAVRVSAATAPRTPAKKAPAKAPATKAPATKAPARKAPAAPVNRRIERLSPAEALEENGFYIYRQLFSAAEAAELARRMKAEAGIVEGQRYMQADATNVLESTREVLFDDRVISAVRNAIGAQPYYLQISDLQYFRDAGTWHRDSVHRAGDASEAPDWKNLDEGPYRVAKAIVYLESDNAGLGIMAGSHRSPVAMNVNAAKRAEEAARSLVVDDIVEPNQRFDDATKSRPIVWRARPGDVLVFDERLYHTGRRVTDDGRVTDDRSAAKLTLTLVFGTDTRHSQRFYSYFRFARRELEYAPLSDSFVAQLGEHGLLLPSGYGNYYERTPDDLRHAFINPPSKLEALVEEFRRAGATGDVA